MAHTNVIIIQTRTLNILSLGLVLIRSKDRNLLSDYQTFWAIVDLINFMIAVMKLIISMR